MMKSLATKQDLQNWTGDISKTLNNQKNNLNQGVSDIAHQAIKDAWSDGRTKSYADLEQKFEGQQARIDRMNVSKARAEVMASADHSKIEQLDQVVNKLVIVINHNSNLLRQLINKVQQPVDIDGHDLLRVMREEANSTTSQLLSKEVVTYINRIKDSIEMDKQEVTKSHKVMENVLTKFSNSSLVILAGILLSGVMPWWPVKIIVGIGAIIGGIIYGKD
ncbi:MAG: hypothetical protein H9843_05655 [Candidatus Limosilactobacillus merdavium]|uniref:Uncharacterized protein n=1 Tax=Candidatus Limosilactobacillus merdavium TaxID=2838651 RepID=A0A9E2NXB4_9LACO|nr:hypothetical protein [Candidatus Limosilactobacillus merdavium]